MGRGVPKVVLDTGGQNEDLVSVCKCLSWACPLAGEDGSGGHAAALVGRPCDLPPNAVRVS